MSRYIIPDHEKGRTDSNYTGENGVDMLGKHKVLGKAIKAFDEKTTDDKLSSIDGERRK